MIIRMQSDASQASLMEMKMALLKQRKPEEVQGKRKTPRLSQSLRRLLRTTFMWEPEGARLLTATVSLKE
jgi:hypothetical protein